MKLDFEELKTAAPLDAVAIFLGLTLKKEGAAFRTGCPACKTTNPRAIVITPSTGQWYCWGSRVGGKTPINFTCHIRGLDPKTASREAAQLLAAHFLPSSAPPEAVATVPQRPEAAAQAATASKPGVESVHSKLQFDHPKVKEWEGLDAKTAEQLGIGWKQSGMLGGRVLTPLRLQDGTPVGYRGYNPEKDQPVKYGTLHLP